MDAPPRRQPRFLTERTECRFPGNAATKTAISAISLATFLARMHRWPFFRKRGNENSHFGNIAGYVSCQNAQKADFPETRRGKCPLPAFVAQACWVFGAGLRTFWRELAETLQTGATGSSAWPIPGTGLLHSGRPAPSELQAGATGSSVRPIPGTGLRHSNRPAPSESQTGATGGSVRPIPGTGLRHSNRPAPSESQAGAVQITDRPCLWRRSADFRPPPKSKANETFYARNFLSNGYK